MKIVFLNLKTNNIYYGLLDPKPKCILITIILSIVLIILSYSLVNQKPDLEKLSSYECGFEPCKNTRFDIKFCVIVILIFFFMLTSESTTDSGDLQELVSENVILKVVSVLALTPLVFFSNSSNPRPNRVGPSSGNETDLNALERLSQEQLVRRLAENRAEAQRLQEFVNATTDQIDSNTSLSIADRVRLRSTLRRCQRHLNRTYPPT